jgi:hypothetical protein
MACLANSPWVQGIGLDILVICVLRAAADSLLSVTGSSGLLCLLLHLLASRVI